MCMVMKHMPNEIRHRHVGLAQILQCHLHSLQAEAFHDKILLMEKLFSARVSVTAELLQKVAESESRSCIL